MILTIPAQVLQEEVLRLTCAETSDNFGYNRGAIDALTWLFCGAKAPSEGGGVGIPVLCTGASHVH